MLIALYKLFKRHKVWLYLVRVIHLDFYPQQEAYLSKQSFKILTQSSIYDLFIYVVSVTD